MITSNFGWHCITKTFLLGFLFSLIHRIHLSFNLQPDTQRLAYMLLWLCMIYWLRSPVLLSPTL